MEPVLLCDKDGGIVLPDFCLSLWYSGAFVFASAANSLAPDKTPTESQTRRALGSAFTRHKKMAGDFRVIVPIGLMLRVVIEKLPTISTEAGLTNVVIPLARFRPPVNVLELVPETGHIFRYPLHIAAAVDGKGFTVQPRLDRPEAVESREAIRQAFDLAGGKDKAP
jgi:hypothetical protein